MFTLAERAELLGPIQTFDSTAFSGDSEVPQELCDIVLAFALVFNDCRDLLLWTDDVLEQTPKEGRLTRLVGEHGGTVAHTFRLFSGLIFELCELIRKNSRWLNEAYFVRKVLPKLSKEHRTMWGRLHDLAHAKAGERPVTDFLEFMRNKTAYHYDSPELSTSYRTRFPAGSTERWKQPLVSLGERVRNGRFFFADAAAVETVEREVEQRGLAPMGPKMTELLRQVSTTMERIVEVFLQSRRAWRDFREDDPEPKT